MKPSGTIGDSGFSSKTENEESSESVSFLAFVFMVPF